MGRVIAGRYAVQVSLGRGGMGEVFLAQDQLLQRRVAIKEILSGRESGLDPVAVERLIREARLAAGIQHPHVVAVHDLIVENDQTFIVMEYLEARSLAEMIRTQGSVDPSTVARIGSQVAGALEAAHRAGIIHRDVKPSNILIDADGTAKLADFGVARGAGDANLTGTGMVIGSVAFMSPEVAKGDPASPAADIFSLGCTLYAAIEGHAPFTDTAEPTNGMRTLVRLISETAPPATHAGPLGPLLARMLDPDPKQRPSAGETQRQLATLSITPNEHIPAPPAETDAPSRAATVLPSVARPDEPVDTTRLVDGRRVMDDYAEPDARIEALLDSTPSPATAIPDATLTTMRPSFFSLEAAPYATIARPTPPTSTNRRATKPTSPRQSAVADNAVEPAIPARIGVEPDMLVKASADASAKPTVSAPPRDWAPSEVSPPDSPEILPGAAASALGAPTVSAAAPSDSDQHAGEVIARGSRAPRRRAAAVIAGTAAVALITGGTWYASRAPAPSGTAAPAAASTSSAASSPSAGSTPAAQATGARGQLEKVSTIKLGGSIGDIALDLGRNLIYGADSSNREIRVADLADGRSVAKIKVSDLKSPYGVGYAADTILMPNTYSNKLTIIDAVSRKVRAHVAVGRTPLDAELNEGGTIAVVPNSESGTVSLVSLDRGNTVTTIRVGKWPEKAAVSAQLGIALVANNFSNSISMISIAEKRVVKTIKVGKAPTDVRADPDSGIAYVSNEQGNSISVLNISERKVVDTIKGIEMPGGMAIDPATHLLFATYWNGLAVIDTETRKVLSRTAMDVTTGVIEIDPEKQLVYVLDSFTNKVSVLHYAS